MIYPDNFEIKIGFVNVRGSIADLCMSHSAKEKCISMNYSSDYDVVRARLEEVDELMDIIESGDDIPLHNFRDVDGLLRQLIVDGSFLTEDELSSLRKTLTSINEISIFFSKRTADGVSTCPQLNEIASRLITFNSLIKEIDAVIDPFGSVRDNASPELARIRASLVSLSGTINSVMRRVISKAVSDGVIDSDTAPAMRDGRLVIPVQPMHKRKINGIVHDESASGKTIFIEPAEVVEVNNRVRELQMDERREIKRILIETASLIRPLSEDILSSADLVAMFDFIHAKAMYAIQTDAKMPHLERDTQMELYHACHPVLKQSLEKSGREIVPLNITLDRDRRLLLISGPNAGGKSVCLKTVGILQYMLQCGVIPTVFENSHMGIFDDIFMDIGDNQSIEDDLSTYSSHLRNMKMIIRHANDRSIVLIDEFGGGTEPQIGGAIAQAILKNINSKGVWGIITTHYQNLKHFAEETPGLINGSMLYDRQQMKPLFQLSIGHPGSSFAIEIARKTGLPAEILKEAEEIVGSDYINMDKYLLDIARDRRYWENKRHEIRQKEKKLEQTLERYESDANELRQQRREIISEAKAEAKAILDQSNKMIERTISDIRRTQAEKTRTLEARKRLSEQKEELLSDESVRDSKLLRKAPKTKRKQKTETVASEKTHRPIAVGDVVKLDGNGVAGKVVEINGSQATVIFGQLKTNVAVSRLKHTMSKISSGVTRQASIVSDSTSAESRKRQLDFSQQIDLRGMRADEAIQAVTYYIDDAIQFNIHRVRILHGTGTGALRQAIRSYLDTVPGVKSFRDEHVQFGGAGITVVDLD